MGLEGNKQYLVRERVSRLCFWSPGVLNTLLGSGRKTFIRENNEGPKLRSSGGARRWTKAQVAEFYLGRSQDPSFPNLEEEGEGHINGDKFIGMVLDFRYLISLNLILYLN